MKRERKSWSEYFMRLVYVVSSRSRDESTNVGAVIVGPNREIRSTGYNSFPRGLNDYEEERQERPEKYFWFEHAERNAIYNAAFMGVSLKDCEMYTNGIPCSDCGRAIIQSGIARVYYHLEWQGSDKWQKEALRTKIMFEESGVELVGLSLNFEESDKIICRGDVIADINIKFGK